MSTPTRDPSDSLFPPVGSIKEAHVIARMVSASIDPVIRNLAAQAADDEIKLAYVRHVTRLSELIKEVERGLAVGESPGFFQGIHDDIQRHRNAIRDIQRTQSGRCD